jgi:hypothetical protein
MQGIPGNEKAARGRMDDGKELVRSGRNREEGGRRQRAVPSHDADSARTRKNHIGLR